MERYARKENLKLFLKRLLSIKCWVQDVNDLKNGITKKDLLLVLTLPIIATIIEILPENVQYIFRLNLQNPSWWQFFTAAYTHQYFQHYFNNISLFLIIAIPQLVIANKMSMKKRYFQLLGATFLLLPVLSSAYDVSYTEKLFVNMQIICGSSGIVSAMLGFLPIMFMGYLSKEYGKKMVGTKLMLMASFYIGLILLLTYALFTSLVQMAFLSVAILALLYLYRSNLRYILKGINDAFRQNLILYYILIEMPIFFLGTPLILFPITLQQNGSGVDVFVHYIGAIFGIYLSYFFFEKLGTEKQPFSYHFRPKSNSFLDFRK